MIEAFIIYCIGIPCTFVGGMMYSDVEGLDLPIVHILATALFWPISLLIFLFKSLMWVITKNDWWLE